MYAVIMQVILNKNKTARLTKYHDILMKPDNMLCILHLCQLTYNYSTLNTKIWSSA